MTPISRYARVAAVLMPLAATATRAQENTAAASGPPIQKVSTASAVSADPLGSINSVRELPDGRVIVNDGSRRRLLVMDSTLHTVQVLLDSLTDVENTYGQRAGALLPYRADSTLFVDPASYAMLVITPNAEIAKVRSVWRVQDAGLLTNTTTFGWPGLGANGRIVYRVPATAAPPKVAPPPGVPYFPPQPDSAFIVAADLSTRKIDTLGVIHIATQNLRIRETSEGGITIDQIVNPLPSTDEWAVLPDGRVAFVRGRDYRIEYRNPDGTWTSSQKQPYDWQRMTDEAKQNMIDSTRTVLEKNATNQWIASLIRFVNQYNGKYPDKLVVPEGFVVPPGFPKDWMLPPGVSFPANYVYACAPGQEPTASGGPGPVGTQTMTIQGGPPGSTGQTRVTQSTGSDMTFQRGAPGPGGAAPMTTSFGGPSCLPAPVSVNIGSPPPPPTKRVVATVDPSDLPDYRPPFLPGSVRADADNNLWVRTTPTKPIPGGSVYDIINPEGVMVDRIQLPVGYTIVGFGKGRVVYASMRDATGNHLARIRLK